MRLSLARGFSYVTSARRANQSIVIETTTRIGSR
jgi:hypothetical protein